MKARIDPSIIDSYGNPGIPPTGLGVVRLLIRARDFKGMYPDIHTNQFLSRACIIVV